MIVIDTYKKRKAVYDIFNKVNKENDMSNIQGKIQLSVGVQPVCKYLDYIKNALENARSYIVETNKKEWKSKFKGNISQSCKVIDDILITIRSAEHSPNLNEKDIDLVSKKLTGIGVSTFLFSVGAALDFIPSIRILNKWGKNLPILYDNCIKAKEGGTQTIVIDTWEKRTAIYDILSQADKQNDMSNIRGDSWLGSLKGTGKKFYGMYPVRRYLNCIKSALESAKSYIMQTKKKEKSSKFRMNNSQSCTVIDDILKYIRWSNFDLNSNKKMVILISKKLKGIKKSTFLFSIGAALDFIPSIRILNKWGRNLPTLYDNCINVRGEVIEFSKRITDYIITLSISANNQSNIERKCKILKNIFNQMAEYVSACGGWIFRDCNVDPYNGNYDGKYLGKTSWCKFDLISSDDNRKICLHIGRIISFIYKNEILPDTNHDCYSDEFNRYTKNLLTGLQKTLKN